MKLRPYLGTWPVQSKWCNRPTMVGYFFCLMMLCVSRYVARSSELYRLPTSRMQQTPATPDYRERRNTLMNGSANRGRIKGAPVPTLRLPSRPNTTTAHRTVWALNAHVASAQKEVMNMD